MAEKRSLLFYSSLVFAIHLIGNPHYGFFRDELYFIVCGFRPDWGYVDQPPLIPLLAAGSQIFGQSLFLLRAFAAALAAASVYITCLLVVEFGGKAFAQRFAALVAFLCPVLMSFGMKISTDMVGLALWPLAALFVTRAVKGASPRNWIYAGIALGLSFEAKISVVFFAIAILSGLLLTRTRKAVSSPWAWLGAFVCVIISLPFVFWQLRQGFPMLELLQNGQNGKNLVLNPLEFLLSQLLITNPLLAPIWIAGLFWLFRRPNFRFLALAWVVIMAEMILLHGKHYYAANIYPILIAAGGVAFEAWTINKKILKATISAVALFGGLILAPYTMPILPVDTFVTYHQVVAPILHLEMTRTENHGEVRLPQDWADMHGWPELAELVANVYESLPPEERAKAAISASNYGEAAAIDFFGKSRSLPPVLSGHNQYHLWGTRGQTAEILIDVNGDCSKSHDLYRSASLAATFTHPWVMPYENDIPIMICRGLNKPFQEIWAKKKHFR